MKKIEFELPIYAYQIDFAGHVSNIVYVQRMEIGRQELFDAVGMPVEQIADDGIVPVGLFVHRESMRPHRLSRAM